MAAAIREKAPDAEIFAIKVFDRELAATGQALVAACEHALTLDAQIVNLSLGTQNVDHEAALADVVARLHEQRRDRDRGRRAGRRALAAGIARRSLGGARSTGRCRATPAGSIG